MVHDGSGGVYDVHDQWCNVVRYKKLVACISYFVNCNCNPNFKFLRT